MMRWRATSLASGYWACPANTPRTAGCRSTRCATTRPLRGLPTPSDRPRSSRAAGFVGLAAARPEGVRVGQYRVDLPPFAGGSGDPNLVLRSETAGGVDLFLGEQPFAGKPGDFGVHRVAVRNFDAEMVERSAVAEVLYQHELERGFGDGEVGVAGFDLGGFGVEELGVEGDCLVQI